MARAAIGLAVALAACAPMTSPSVEVEAMRLTSTAFAEGQPIPPLHTCDGQDASPPLAWTDVPDGTRSFALIVEDPDARGFVHWVLADIPGDARELAGGGGDAVGVPGRNDFGRRGWGGPCPPSGEHRYTFTLYALSAQVGVPAEVDAASVRDAMAGLVVGEATLTGVYRRNR